jgi:aminomethyltransferase
MRRGASRMLRAMKTPLYDIHVAAGARMAPFAGWDMPIQYEGILAEHLHTRSATSIFDTCHMGEFEISGPSAQTDLERLLTMAVGSIAVGQCRYGFLLRDDGGVLDDLTCYRLAADRFMLIVNAGTRAGDATWIRSRLAPSTRFEDLSPRTGKLDVQGPESRAAMEKTFGVRLPDLKYFHFAEVTLLDKPCILSRTGYTGEWGYEIYFPASATGAFWSELTLRGGAKPAGLGARDTLRLEVGYPLYGHELSADRTPAAATRGTFIDLSKDFVGKAAVARDLEQGASRYLAGIELETKRAARAGDKVFEGAREAGEVTSGSLAPSLDRAVALAYLDADLCRPGAGVEIDVRGRRLPARVVELPFYKQGTARRAKA